MFEPQLLEQPAHALTNTSKGFMQFRIDFEFVHPTTQAMMEAKAGAIAPFFFSILTPLCVRDKVRIGLIVI